MAWAHLNIIPSIPISLRARSGARLCAGKAASSITSKGKKRKWKDFSKLPPEERERREKQRMMQQEAVARRESGEEILTRHPLNSERRRANRRKPGRAGKIAQLKKEQKAKQQNVRDYNAGGYVMRHMKKNDSRHEGTR